MSSTATPRWWMPLATTTAMLAACRSEPACKQLWIDRHRTGALLCPIRATFAVRLAVGGGLGCPERPPNKAWRVRPLLVGGRQDPHRADRLRRVRLRDHVGEERLQLVAD